MYNSGDSETSDDEGDFEKIEYEELKKEHPLEYKTRTEESFIEYFQKGEVKHIHTRLINYIFLCFQCFALISLEVEGVLP